MAKYTTKDFNDGQVSATCLEEGDLNLVIRGSSYKDLFTAASVKEAWDANLKNKTHNATLRITCLIAQRSDRRFNDGESFDLKIVARFINSMKFDCVEILHPHSPISLALIEKSIVVDHFEFVEKAYHELEQPVLISPDAGAYKTTHNIAERLNADLIPANKVRVSGEPIIQIQGEVQNKKCLIIDDLADGGRTFINLAKELKKQGALDVYLYVTHGQFNFGFSELKGNPSAKYVRYTSKRFTIDYNFHLCGSSSSSLLALCSGITFRT